MFTTEFNALPMDKCYHTISSAVCTSGDCIRNEERITAGNKLNQNVLKNMLIATNTQPLYRKSKMEASIISKTTVV